LDLFGFTDIAMIGNDDYDLFISVFFLYRFWSGNQFMKVIFEAPKKKPRP